MVDREMRGTEEGVDTRMDQRLDHLDKDLDIMERHAAEMSAVEEGIQGEMRKWDREYKDARFHSVPRPRKHVR